ncbi:hypothetical protein Vau01_013150 [Virgisporangium aurantiacum]|uniref:Uncharacterized protein n=1 Tax=Virgisporangium aurantiacum TaxID=175570 RepID=A0A8J4DXD2_9ACTN|nr:hypothetical protein Vau01_013150 [Virgisporangium aurantiacum]
MISSANPHNPTNAQRLISCNSRFHCIDLGGGGAAAQACAAVSNAGPAICGTTPVADPGCPDAGAPGYGWPDAGAPG